MFDLSDTLGLTPLKSTPGNMFLAKGIMFDIESVKPEICKAHFMATSVLINDASNDEYGDYLINLTTYFESAMDSQGQFINPETLAGNAWEVHFDLFIPYRPDLPIAGFPRVIRQIPHGVTPIAPAEQEDQQPFCAPCLLDNPFLCPLECTDVPGKFTLATERLPLTIDDVPLAESYLERFIQLRDTVDLNWEPKKDHLAIIDTLAAEVVRQKLSSRPTASTAEASLTLPVPKYSDAVVCEITLDLDCEIDPEYGRLCHSDDYGDFLLEFPGSLLKHNLPQWRFRACLNVDYHPFLFS